MRIRELVKFEKEINDELLAWVVKNDVLDMSIWRSLSRMIRRRIFRSYLKELNR